MNRKIAVMLLVGAIFLTIALARSCKGTGEAVHQAAEMFTGVHAIRERPRIEDQIHSITDEYEERVRKHLPPHKQ